MIILKLNISKCDLNIISQFHLSELIAHHTTTVELASRVLLRMPFLKFSIEVVCQAVKILALQRM